MTQDQESASNNKFKNFQKNPSSSIRNSLKLLTTKYEISVTHHRIKKKRIVQSKILLQRRNVTNTSRF